MKKNILIAIILLMVLLTPNVAQAGHKVVMNPKDSLMIVDGSDTVYVANLASLSKLHVDLADAINDTLLKFTRSDSLAVDDARGGLDEELLTARAISSEWAQVVKFIAFMAFLIVLLVLLFRYLNRRSKLRVIEKAVLAGQPLPDGFLNDQRRVVIVQQPVPMMNQSASVQSMASELKANQDGAIIGSPIAPSAFSWEVMKGAVKWIAWGMGITLFFLFAGSSEMAMVGLPLVFVGVAKWYFRSQEIKSFNQQLERERKQQHDHEQ